jgi:anti-sigma regulatory factor (Ser/Thr protein kinase)
VHATRRFVDAELGVREAREWSVGRTSEWGIDGAWQPWVMLLVTELVTNAFRHAGSECSLGLSFRSGVLRIEAIDDSPVVPQYKEPGELGGFGMRIIDALAERWGTVPGPHSKAVWLEVDTSAPPPV